MKGKEDIRIRNDQSIWDWFRGIVGQSEDVVDLILESAINDHFSLMGSLSWKDGCISFCRLHALIVEECTLLDFYSSEGTDNSKTQYYRLDYDPSKPGPLFSEPIPHIHCCPEGSPRIPLPGNDDETLPIRFLEFIYLNHFQQDWIKWVKEEVKCRGKIDLPIDAIVEGYASGSILARLDDFDPHLNELRAILGASKRNHSRSSSLIPPAIRTLNYTATDATS
ncbi:MAG: hypothetical protein JJU20_06440 [Opitutales bacterium]|nr:hypothetical protein [Opitutales bacterium]